MQVRETWEREEGLHDVREGGEGVFHEHSCAVEIRKHHGVEGGQNFTLEGTPRTDTNADLRLADRFRGSGHDLEKQTRSVLGAPAVRVRALVCRVLQECVEQISIRAIQPSV